MNDLRKKNRAESLASTPSRVGAGLAARNQIQRHIKALHFFATLPNSAFYDGSERPEKIDWETFHFKQEFHDLKLNGYVSGTVDHSKPSVILNPRITVSGSVKLAELSEYLWKTSTLGRITSSLVKFFWLVIGVVIGYVASIILSTPP